MLPPTEMSISPVTITSMTPHATIAGWAQLTRIPPSVEKLRKDKLRSETMPTIRRITIASAYSRFAAIVHRISLKLRGGFGV